MDTRVEDKPIVKPGEPAEPAQPPLPSHQIGRGLLPLRSITAGFSLSPLNRRRWQNFKANRRAFWSLWIFLVLFLVTLCAEFVANDRPLVVNFRGEWRFPVLSFYSEADFGGEFQTEAEYHSPEVRCLIRTGGVEACLCDVLGAGDPNRVWDALPELMHLVVGSYLGNEAAEEEFEVAKELLEGDRERLGGEAR